VLPTAVTLFHELFHLVLGNEITYPESGNEENRVDRLLEMSLNNALRNPESYAVVAVAYDYTRNSAVDSSGNRVEFFTGIATQG
jgi:hypothetical protein